MGKTVYDGFMSLHEGMDAATPADFGSMQYRSSMSVNVSHRGGYPHQRPAYIKHDLDFQDEANVETRFEDGLFQGASAYYPDSGSPIIVASVSGRMFTIEPTSGYRVNEVTPADGPDNSWRLKAWFTQVEKWLVKQNGVDHPIIFDGASCRRPDANELKTGTCGVYAWGRYWYALPDGRSYRATDLVWGNGNRDDVLKETENTFLNGGGNFAVPGSAGQIRSMVAPAVMDNALGQGPVHVFCDTAIFTNSAPVDRDTWQDVTYPIQTVTLNQNGATSDWSTVLVNGDVFYRSKDGFRSYFIARRDFGNWGNTPISREVETFYANDNGELLANSTGAVWQNRALFGVMPKLIDGKGIVCRGLVVMDFDLISTLKAKVPPAWDGMWTGLQIHQLVPVTIGGVERLFAFVRSNNNTLELWEIRSDKRLDDDTKQIEWIVIPRQMDFGMRWTPKKLVSGELFVRSMYGEVDFTVQYMPDDYRCPVDWSEFSECATTTNCDTEDCLALVNRHPQYRTRRKLPMPTDECNTVSNRNMRLGYKFQPVISVRGAVTLTGMRLIAETTDDIAEVVCGDAECKVHECCPIDPTAYSAEENPT